MKKNRKIKFGTARISPLDRRNMRYIVYVPRGWRRREVMKLLRVNFLNDIAFFGPAGYNERLKYLAEATWAVFCTDFVNHWASRQGFKSLLKKWGIRLVEKGFDFPYQLGSY